MTVRYLLHRPQPRRWAQVSVIANRTPSDFCVWDELMPGRCAGCGSAVRLWARVWWDTPTTRHLTCSTARVAA